MILVGLASFWINVRYQVYGISPFGGPVNQEFSASDSASEDAAMKEVAAPELVGQGGKKKKVKKTFDGELTGGQLIKKDKQGRTMVDVITSLKAEDLGVPGADGDEDRSSLTLEEASKGREPIIRILKEAGIEDFDPATVAKLPSWDQVEALYGKGPVVYGLDTCKKFRESVPAEDASVASAGIFNSGTNTLAMYMNANCVMPENKKEKYGGMRWQVPWGKHMVAKRKWTNTVSNDRKVNKTTVMPIVAIRDPYSWMQSMCRHPYAAKWHHSPKHCPNLVPDQRDMNLFPFLEDQIPVKIKYPEESEHWDNLVHLWNDWYRQYYDADYPRLIVRFEDLLFNVKEMVQTVCECVGGVPRQEGQFAYVVDSGKFGKGHPEKGAKHTNMISAMAKYGSDKHRYTSLTDEDLTLAYENLDPELMMAFQYAMTPPP